MPLSRNSVVVASEDQVSTTVGEEVVILGMHDGVYYGLEHVGSRLWELLRAPRRVSDLVAAITADFDVEADRCEQDLLPLLERLAERRLVREVLDG
ncbi:MAG TPA: PqqD family peptide modification chaperone [Gemmatimonadaceae bacterium]